MKNRKHLYKLLLVGLLLPGAVARSNADSTVLVNSGAAWQGFMNVFEIPQNGGGYVFGSSWGTADLTAVFSASTLTLGPNSVNDPSSFWYIPSGGPGAVGNKIMDASMYVETTGVYSGQTLTFSGTVLANTLVGNMDPLGNGWTSVAFIKDFVADYSSSVSVTVALTPGPFSINLAANADPGHHIQYGFETIGPDVWITDVGPYGDIQIEAVPEPSALALLGIGSLALLTLRRRN
jgi:hypothetical protein